MHNLTVLILSIFITTACLAQTSSNVTLSSKEKKERFNRHLFIEDGYAYSLFEERTGKTTLQRINKDLSTTEKIIITLPGEYKKERRWNILPLKNSIALFYLAMDKKTRNAAIKCIHFNKVNFTISSNISTVKEFSNCDYGLINNNHSIKLSDDASKVLITYLYRSTRKDDIEFHIDVRDIELKPVWNLEIKEKSLEDYDHLFYNSNSYIANSGKVILEKQKKVGEETQTAFLLYSADSKENYREITPDHGEYSIHAKYDELYWKGNELIMGGTYIKKGEYSRTFLGYFGMGMNIENEKISWAFGAPFETDFLLSDLWTSISKQKENKEEGNIAVAFSPQYEGIYTDKEYALLLFSEYSLGRAVGNLIVYRYSKITGKLINKFKVRHFRSYPDGIWRLEFKTGMIKSHVCVLFEDETNLYNYETKTQEQIRENNKEVMAMIKIPFKGTGKEHTRDLLWYKKDVGEGKMYPTKHAIYDDNGSFFYFDAGSLQQMGYIKFK